MPPELDEPLAVAVARLDERVVQFKKSTEQGFEQIARDVELARSQYPTQKDITQGLEKALGESRSVAREEADRVYQRAAQEGRSQADKAEAATAGLAEQTERSIDNLAGQVTALRTEILSKIEDAKSSQTVVVVIAAIGMLSGVAGFVFRFAG